MTLIEGMTVAGITLVVSGMLLSCDQQPAAPPAPEPAPPPVSIGTTGGDSPAPSLDVLAQTAQALSAAGVTFDIPKDWVEEKPSNTMRLAQYSLPGEAGAAELTVFAFGPGQGGDTQANIDRWVGQFSPPDTPGESPKKEVASFEQNGLKISVVKTSGTYTPTSMGPMVPAGPPQEKYALYGIIVEGGAQGSVFVKVTGPAATVSQHSEELDRFTRSVRKAT